MKLSVIIVNYNVRYYVEQCINSVFRATKGIDTEVFVFDNHSRDNSIEFLRRRFGKRVHLIESNHNLGFARANNKAIQQSTGEYILLLNPDTIVGEDSISQVIDFMESHPNAGGVGVMMHNPNGTIAKESRRGIPTPFVSLLKMLGFSKRYYMSHLSWDVPGKIEVISGAFCMTRRSVLNTIGLLDKDFFMYGEDIDLSYRIIEGGYENWYVPAHILHYKGESTQKSSYRYVHVFYQAMLIFFRKHFGHLSFIISLPIKTAIYLRAFMALINMQYTRMQHSLGLGVRHDANMQYCFVGSAPMLEECRQLSLRKGLDASFSDSLSQVEPCDILVFDTDMFSYESILAYSRDHAGHFQIGTFNRKNRILITPNEIIK